MRVAALDLGTNTFLCLIADVENGEITRVISDQARVVRLGQGVHQSRSFHPEALRRADECLRDYAEEIRRHNVSRIVAAATSAARDVTNREELLQIGRRHGIDIEVISGEREAECTFAGTIDGPIESEIAIIDVGGGSTEFILGDQTGITKKVSVDVGSVRLTELFVTKHPVAKDEMLALRKYIDEKMEQARRELGDRAPKRVVAVAGTPTTLAALDMGLPFDAHLVHGYQLELTKLRAWIERLASMTVKERQALGGMDAKRADVIVAGALILYLGGEHFQSTALEVSVRGLRYGLARMAEQR